MKSYKERVNQLKQEILDIEVELRENIYAIIREVASEQKLNRITKHIYIMKFSEISGKPWDSVFHNWEVSADMLIKKLDGQRSLDLYDYLVNLYEKRTNDRCTFKYKTTYKCQCFRVYDEVTQVLDSKFVKRIIDKLNGLE